MTKSVQAAWNKRAKLRAEGDKLRAEGEKLHAEGKKLHAEDDKLWAEGDIIFMDAVIKTYGNIPIKWNDNGSCTLTIGESITLKASQG